MDEAVQEVTGGVLTIGGGIFSRGYKIQPPKYGMTEGEFRDLLNVADYSRAKGFKAEDIRKHGVFESIGATESIWLRLDRAMVQSESGPFILDLGAIVNRAMTGSRTGAVAGLLK